MRPENFPLDTIIFTGKMPLERFEEERPEEYKRLQEEGSLHEVLTDAPSQRARIFAATFGYATFAIGTLLIIAIFASFLFYR